MLTFTNHFALATALVLLWGCGGTTPQTESNQSATPLPPAPAAPVVVTTPIKAAPVIASPPVQHATVGGGTIDQPAIGPAPTQGVDGPGFVLVKNWDFGKDGTITSVTDLTEHFQYHDQFGTIANQYGAVIVAPSEAEALKNRNQPIEGADTGGKPAREFFPDSMKTYLVPLRGATECLPTRHDVGCGSFQAKWKLPKGGSRLGLDVLWETRVRYVTPPYFWFAIWTCGNKWGKGAEIDVVESFGYDNGGSYTNYDGRFWHVGIIRGREDEPYHDWQASMKKFGVSSFDASVYHTWTMLYKADNTITISMDGIPVQTGFSHWTLNTDENGEPIDMSFIFDGGWGHTEIASVNKPLPATAFAHAFYEWDYSRVYLRPAASAPK